MADEGLVEDVHYKGRESTNRAVTSCSSSQASWCVSWLLPVLLHVQMRSLYLCRRASYSLEKRRGQGNDNAH